MDARNGLESYCYNLKNQLEDEEKGIGGKVDADDKEALEQAVKDALEWLDENQSAEAEEFQAKLKEVERVANPIMAKVYQQSGGGPGMGGAPGGGDDDDFGHEEL